jgi:S1-C subfamily serine protease
MMLRRVVLAAAALTVAAPLAAFAGEGKCTMGDAQACLNHTTADAKSWGWLGVDKEQDAATGGWVVKSVIAGSPAEKAGLKAGDLVVAVNGFRLSKDMDKAKYKEVKAGLKPGATARYTVMRGGSESVVAATLGTYPQDVLAKMVGEHMLTSHVAATTASAEAKTEKSKY